jgi:cell division transport system permease protein
MSAHLTRFKFLLERHIQAAIYSLRVICAKPFAMFSTVVVIAVALTLPTLFWMLSDNLQTITNDWQHKAQLSIYLTLPIEEAQMRQTLQAVQEVSGVAKATLKTPQEGLKELEAQEGMQDIMRYLPNNPLPAVIEVVPVLGEETPVKMKQLFLRLKDLPGVEQVKFDMDWIKRLHAVLGLVRALVTGMLLLLASGVVLIIGNTLRLALNLRHEEIQVLKLVGATNDYIMRPFLYSGIWYGLLGAIGAIFFVNVFLLSLGGAIEQLVKIYEMHYPFIGLGIKQAYMLILFSAALGWLAAQGFIRRQLSSIEPG